MISVLHILPVLFIVMTLIFLYSSRLEQKNGWARKSKPQKGGLINYLLRQQAE